MTAGDSHKSFASGLFPSHKPSPSQPCPPNSPWYCCERKGYPNHLWVSWVSDSSLSAFSHRGNCMEEGKPQI